MEARPELVGKRFLCVSGEEPLELGEIGRWGWRAGVIRAVSHRDNDNAELTVRNATVLCTVRQIPNPACYGSRNLSVRHISTGLSQDIPEAFCMENGSSRAASS